MSISLTDIEISEQKKIVERIAFHTKESGMKQVELLRKAGLFKSILSNWRNGHSRISEDSLSKIAKVLDVDIEELRGQPPRLTVAQSLLIRYYAGGIQSLQQALTYALKHPEWSEQELKSVQARGQQLPPDLFALAPDSEE